MRIRTCAYQISYSVCVQKVPQSHNIVKTRMNPMLLAWDKRPTLYHKARIFPQNEVIIS